MAARSASLASQALCTAHPGPGLAAGRRAPAVAGTGALSRSPAARTGLAHSRSLQLRAAGPEAREAGVSTQQGDADAPFLEPLVRSLLLGVGTSWLLETAHVALQVCGLASCVPISSLSDLLQLLPSVGQPLFLADHAAAIATFLGFYVIEAAAASTASPAGSLLAAAAALPKKMVPLNHRDVRLHLFKQLILQRRRTSSAAAPGAPAPEAPSASTLLAGRPSGSLQQPLGTPSLPPPTRQPRQAGNIVPLGRGSGLVERARQPGGKQAGDSASAGRQQELRDREGYLKNFWYAAAFSESLRPGEPQEVGLCGQRLVLFRGQDGAVRCLDNVCPHRGAPLSGGWVAEVEGSSSSSSCIVCAYHGWAFDGEGRLRDVPAAEGPGHWPKRPLVPSYPVEEKGGFIWVFWGSKDLPAEERPPIPHIPELDAPGWKAVYGEIEFEANHFSVFENALDMAHIHYLHDDSFGNMDAPQIRGMQVSTGAYDVTATFRLTNKPASALWEWSRVEEVEVTAQAMLPSSSVISFTLGNGLSFVTFVSTVPISARRTVNRFALVRKLAWDATGLFNADAWDSYARSAMLKILGQDREMVERLRPDLLPREVSVRADLPQLAFRKLRQQYVQLGYGQPSELEGAPGQAGQAGQRACSKS